MSNYLRTKEITIGDRTIVVKEISLAAQLRLEQIENRTFDDIIKESISPEDYAIYQDKENIPANFALRLVAAHNEVNSISKEKTVLRENQEQTNNFRRTSDGSEEKTI